MEIPYTVNARPDTGLWNAKVGVWLFLASEVMLFGGLFSSYIFLRLGADYNWPVQVLDATWGCINTLVLIASSVTIVMAWASLKMGKIGAYRIYLAITILCALGFMAIKTVEYNGKFHHYGVKLTDGTLLEGHFPETGYNVEFEDVTKLTLELDGVYPDSDPADFLRDCKTPEVDREFTVNGAKVTLDAAGMKTLRAQAKEKKQSSVEITAVKPLKFSIHRGGFAFIDPIYSYTNDGVFFKDNTQINGKLVKDSMELAVDLIDVRDCPEPEKSMAWQYVGDGLKTVMLAQRDAQLKHYREKFGDKADPLKSPFFKRHGLVLHEKDFAGTASHEKTEKGGAEHEPSHDGAEAHSGAHHGVTTVIAHKDISFWSNFTPKYNTYYAIYFALTSLHGLHVIAGALVLSYFLFFDNKLLRKDPEHMANRIEVGGLFWHFVDLVWIFLFPLLYLL
jgi:heme/copper-type cytochrome/quinol oxidase subunit 3